MELDLEGNDTSGQKAKLLMSSEAGKDDFVRKSATAGLIIVSDEVSASQVYASLFKHWNNHKSLLGLPIVSLPKQDVEDILNGPSNNFMKFVSTDLGLGKHIKKVLEQVGDVEKDAIVKVKADMSPSKIHEIVKARNDAKVTHVNYRKPD